MCEHVNHKAILEQFVHHKTCCSNADLSIRQKGVLKHSLNAHARSTETTTKKINIKRNKSMIREGLKNKATSQSNSEKADMNLNHLCLTHMFEIAN
jgi:hypothetical protein